MTELNKDLLVRHLLRLADDQLILGHRLSEWCGHAHSLEEELALANIGLDLIGQARMLYSYAGEAEGKGRDEDQLAYLRYERDYENALLVEQPNDDFAHTVVRQLFHAAFMLPYWQWAKGSSDARIAEIAAKAEKEVAYHLRHVSTWTLRLGDGTEESHARMQEALEDLAIYTGELFEMDAVADAMAAAGIAPDLASLKPAFDATLAEVLGAATLSLPSVKWMQSGGRSGRHTEHLGHILSDLQYMQRAYPGLTW